MSPRTWLLVSWIVVGAACLVAHVALLVSVFRSEKLTLPVRLLALVPALAPFVAWAADRRAVTVVWAVLVVAYLVLRALEGAVG
ncbi:MAG: hypothetical protein AB7S26_21425 [Sandaracinaceae bacterium]